VLRAASTQRWLLAIILAGLAIRLSLAPLNIGTGDRPIFKPWARQLVTEPLSSFYAAPMLVDHLPGDMWILWAVAELYRAWSQEPQARELPDLLLKLVPAAADAGIALVLFLLGRGLHTPQAGVVAAAFFMLNPASIFLTSIWGQWDSVSALLALMALWLLWRGNLEFALPVLTYAALIKPAFAAFVPLFALAVIRRHIRPHAPWVPPADATGPPEPLGRLLRRALVGFTTSVLVTVAVLLPFDVGLPLLPAHWSLWERLQYTYDTYQLVTLNAFNLWGLWALPAAWESMPDDLPFLFGVTYNAWGTFLTAAAYAMIVFLSWRTNSRRGLLWACLGLSLSLFMFPTRIHERYLFPAIVYAALAAAISPGLRWMYGALTVSYFANLYWVYAISGAVPLDPFLHTSNVFSSPVSCLNVALFLYVLLRGRAALASAGAKR
jgi:dolichyl-phosphate-mannose-protein mannosyltransferase